MIRKPRILFIDAYDSFAENIAALLCQQLQADLILVKIDTDIAADHKQSSRAFFQSFDAIVLGPGPGDPGNPADSGLFKEVWEYAALDGIPVIGVCLGFQSLCTTYGLPLKRMIQPCHGHAKRVIHNNHDIFHNLNDVIATCYNSLAIPAQSCHLSVAESRPSSSRSSTSLSSLTSHGSSSSFVHDVYRTVGSPIKVLAWDSDGHVMAARHTIHPFWGVQFHPESCKSNESCLQLLENWWKAVQSHNERFGRTVDSPSTTITKTKSQSLLSPAASDGVVRLYSFLEQLSEQPSDCVHFRHITISNAHRQVADLCKYLSAKDSVAMLESTKKGRFSIYTFPHEKTWNLQYQNGICVVTQAGNILLKFPLATNDVLQLVQEFVKNREIKSGHENVPFWGGFVGFMSYEMGTDVLKSENQSSDEGERYVPDCSLMWVDRSIVVDHQEGTACVQSLRSDDSDWVGEMTRLINDMCSQPVQVFSKNDVQTILSSTKISLPDHDQYTRKIQECQEELHAGNSYELCLTTEAIVKTPIGDIHPWKLYNNIQKHNPVPFAAYLELNGTTILSSSPEQFLTWSRTSGVIEMIPMKGTVKKAPGVTLADATAILSTPKETAENLMIADLIRHDLQSAVGRESKVEVTQLCEVIEHETVYQLVSRIRAHIPLPPSSPLLTTSVPQQAHMSNNRNTILSHGHLALRTSLPPGSMTGAPKKRSCEILSRLESRNRGVYSGIIGYFDVGGGGSWSVCIRTAFSHKSEDDVDNGLQTWHVGAGGAITVLSNEEDEWEEMRTKLDSVLKAFRED